MNESDIQGSAGSIFICYRREDSADVTGRIYDRLADHFGSERVFIDVEAIRLGYDFRSEIDQTIKVCSIVIVVIGEEWLAEVAGKRRIDDENDRVRIEIESALRREIPIIPVLTRGASHPTKAMLPASLEALAYRHGTSIRHEHFRTDVDSLISQMDKLLARQDSTASKPVEPKEPTTPAKPTEATRSRPAISPVASIPAIAASKEPPDWKRKRLIIVTAVGATLILLLAITGSLMRRHASVSPAALSGQAPNPASPATPAAPVAATVQTPAAAVAGVPSANFPTYEGKAINIWIVGSPHTGALPSSQVPDEIADNARSVSASIDVKTFRAKDFAATFFAAFEMHSEPDVLVIDNYGIIRGITTPLGNFVGLDSKPEVRDALVSISESLSSFGRGWQFLISTSRNHDKAKALAMVAPKCKPAFIENVSSTTVAEMAQIRAAAISAAYAYLTCNKEGIESLSDKDRLGSGCLNEKEPFFTKTVNACCVLGNDKLSFVPLVASFSSNRAVGQKTVLAALRKTLDKWQLLTITDDPGSLGLLDGPLQTLARSLMQGASAGSPVPAVAELLTPDRELPAPSSGQRFGSFTWKPSASPDVVGEIVEFEYGRATRLFISSDVSQGPKEISTGKLWTTQGIWHWRVWSIAKNGSLALSENRSFKH